MMSWWFARRRILPSRLVDGSAREGGTFCREQIRELGLKMKLVTVEHLLGGERIIFYFLAEHRVDFRELVRRLASQYRTRIEMRQVGARDEARLIADYERCGQRCCCQEFLKNLQPVSMRMAKMQKATLDPSKISGRCGRLMCCLRYEDAGYEELRGKLPKKNTWVRTESLVGRVTDTQILTQLVRLALPDGTAVAVPNESIIERDVPPPPPPSKAPPPPPRTRAPRRKLAPAAPTPAEPAPAAEAEAPATAEAAPSERHGDADAATKKRRPRRRRRRPPGKSKTGARGGSGQPAAKAPRGDKPADGKPGGAPAEGTGKRRARRHRRRKKKP